MSKELYYLEEIRVNFRLLLLNVLLLSTFVFAQNRKIYVDSLFSWDGSGNTTSDYDYGIQTKDLADRSITSAKMDSSTMFWSDTISLIADANDSRVGRVGFLKQLSPSNTYGGGVFYLIDSAYVEGGIAFNSSYSGKQWVRTTFKDENKIYATDYGAIPDNSTDNSTAFNNAIADAITTGADFYVNGTGKYLITSSPVSIGSNVNIYGNGQAWVKAGAALNDGIFDLKGSRVNIKNIKFDGNDANQTSGNTSGIAHIPTVGTSSNYINIEDCYFYDFDDYGIEGSCQDDSIKQVRIINCDFNKISKNAIYYFNGINDFTVSKCHFDSIKSIGIQVYEANGDTISSNITIDHCIMDSIGTVPIEINAYGSNATITGNVINEGTNGISVKFSHITITGNTVKNQTGHGIEIGAGNNMTIVGNTFISCTNSIDHTASQATKNILVVGNSIIDDLGYGIRLRGVDGLLISNNSIYNPTNTGINATYYSASTYDNGIYNKNGIISNNTIVFPANPTDLEPQGIQIAGYNMSVENNFISIDTSIAGSGTNMIYVQYISKNIIIKNNRLFAADTAAPGYGIRLAYTSSADFDNISVTENRVKNFNGGFNSVAANNTEITFKGNIMDNVTSPYSGVGSNNKINSDISFQLYPTSADSIRWIIFNPTSATKDTTDWIGLH